MARDRDWHETFKQWTAASSEHEEALGANARGLIRQALHEHEPLALRRFETYATGSYRNNTNVRYGSDIDVAVVLHDRVFYDLPNSGSPSVAMLEPYPPFHTPMFDLTSFRNEVYHALCERFGGARVGPLCQRS